MVCCSLVNKSCTPGQKDWDKKTSVWAIIKVLAKEITTEDPEFLLKVAVYTRQELNIRITANFLLALAAHLPGSKPHFRRYFCAAVQLPSDWLEVARIYSMVSCFSKSLPSCLKKALVDKFKQFTEYQMAKYNTRKHRCKFYLSFHITFKMLLFFIPLLSENLCCTVEKDTKQSEFSLKKMIKRLHIKEPAEHVMAILGKKYPSDLKAFSRSGLSGVWERERAGKQMKLKQPDTWECKLSQEGNKAATWEKLIDGKSLPFMAMLRNLRNMISVGITEKHHTKILNRLTSKDAVIQSRQFPFRFLSAYKVILELSKFAGGPAVKVPSSREILQGVLKKLPKSKRFGQCNWETIPRKRLRVTMSVPFVYRIFNAKKTQSPEKSKVCIELLNKYRCALEKAVQISCKYNIPPLPGRTLVICSANISDDRDWSGADDVCLPPESTEDTDENKLSASVRYLIVSVISTVQLASVESTKCSQYALLFKKLGLVYLLYGCRFVSERGSSRMLQHVEHMDRVYNIPPPQGHKTEPERAADVISLWKSVRVFISSTFRDMHAERDILVRSVFPELRRRAAPHYLYLQEVELRWGVTEEESNRAVELCLSEVCRSQLLLGILGERYGLVPARPTLPELPQYSWLKSATDGLSITEMEIRQFQALYPDTAQSRMFFCFRSPRLASSVPVAWRTDFVAESKEAEAKMNNLKTWIRNSNFKVTENYPCEWGGVVDGKPYLKCLEDFGRAALENIWEAIQQLFTDEDVASEIEEQEVHQDAQQRQFHGRAKLISMATEKVQESQQKGGILMVEGNPGEGKTVFMVTVHCIHNHRSSSINTHSIIILLLYYRDLLSEFHLNLNDLEKKKPLALLVDGADRVHDSRGQRLSEWIPQHIPKGVCLVLSVTSESSLQNTISKRKGTVSFPLGQLSLPDKKEIVQKQLVEFGKKLSDSAFNNQLQTLLMKKGSVSPLYLRLACEELRNYASFEKVNNDLRIHFLKCIFSDPHNVVLQKKCEVEHYIHDEICRLDEGQLKIDLIYEWKCVLKLQMTISVVNLYKIHVCFSDNMKDFEDCLSFLKRHSLLFSQWPALFVQTALHESCDSSAHLWAESMMRNGGMHAVKWLNCTDAAQKEASELVSTFHSEPSCVEVSPDGKLVAVGTGEGRLHFLHTETGQEVKSLMSSGDGISGCVFLAEELLATTSFDGQVEVWDVANGCRTAHMNAHSNKITGCDVSPDKKLFATVSLDSNLKKSKEVASLMNPSPLNCVNFDLESQLVAVGCWDGGIRLWNWLDQKNSSVRSLSFSPCPSMLCSGCLSGEVRLWSVTAAACVGSYHAHRGCTQSLNFLQGGNLLLSAGHDNDFTIALWSKNTLTSKPWIDPKVMCILRGHNGGVTCLAFSPNGNELLSGGKDQALMIWKVNTSPPVLSQSISNCHGDWITGCAWTSSSLLSCSSDCKLRMWDIQTGCLLREILSSSSLNTLCCWEEHVMAGSTDGLLMVWKWESGIEITRIQAHKSHLEKNVKPEDLLVASASEDGTVKLWHPLQVTNSVLCINNKVSVLRLTESLIISASYDRTVKLWDRHTKKQVGMFVCGGPVKVLEVNPCDPKEFVCGDTQGQLYFLSWKG
uniref:TROVE domain-containing protein n=1 Tax=Cyprinus carpio TaxID=7962 RepID=A0A8C2CVQ4_CYPCA